MSRWRILVVVTLIALPFFCLAGIGSLYLWRQGLSIQVLWPLTFLMILGYVLAWRWQRRQHLLRPVDFTPPIHWTERDVEAWKIVETRARQAAEFDPNRLGDAQIYIETARDLATELAHFYHPTTHDPVGKLTIPEILAVIELAAHDLAETVDQYLPAGHLLTVNDWRRAKQVSDWYRTASNAYWMVSALFSPVNTSLRYMASRMGMARPFELLQKNLIAWFYTAYVHRVGSYLIDLNSGRLRVGAGRYRALRAQWDADLVTPEGERGSEEKPDPERRIAITVLGEVKAGKSSFINALLGEQRARTDVLPATDQITEYVLKAPGMPSRLVVYDTVGYGHEGPREDQLRATEEAAQRSDVLILVLHAKNPARQPDVQMLKSLKDWFASRPELKMPAVLGVMTHIDLLSPAMEWSPPYDWTRPGRVKERQVQEASAAVREQLGQYLVGLVPLCTEPGKVYGIDEYFMPALVEVLDEAHAVALLRCIRAEANTGKIKKSLRQLLQVGVQIAGILWQTWPREPGTSTARSRD
jgi:predicted GTPase